MDKLSKRIFWSTLVVSVIMDGFSSAKNIEVYEFIITGMFVSLVAHILFENGSYGNGRY